MVKILIDTSESKKIKIGLHVGKKKDEITSSSLSLKSEAALPLIDNLLKKHKLSITDVNEIEVGVGNGSFTGLRVGTSIANAFSFLLKIPVNNKKIGDLALPVYNKLR